jgi:hypothetical protein
MLRLGANRWRRTFCAKKLSGNIQRLAPYNNDLLAIENLLGDDAGQTTEEMAFGVNDDLVELH